MALQERWLLSPLPDGRVPAHAMDDEEVDTLVAAWEKADATALEQLDAILAEVGQRARPEAGFEGGLDDPDDAGAVAFGFSTPVPR